MPFGQIKWTATGQPAVDGGDYRFFSTEYAPKDMEVLNPGQTPKRVRPLRLDGLTLTNQPNNKGGSPITNRLWGPDRTYKTRAEYEAAAQENRQHVQANKDAAEKADAQRKADSEGEAAEMALPALEKWCRAVKAVIEATKRSGTPPMHFKDAWTYAKQKFPELYQNAFGSASDGDAEPDTKEVANIANRIAALAGKNFEFGWNFAREELPRIFNRMKAGPGGVRNRLAARTNYATPANAAEIFNRLVRAEMVINRETEHSAFNSVRDRHPGIYGLMRGQMDRSAAFRAEPKIGNLID